MSDVAGCEALPWVIEAGDGRLVGLACDRQQAIETARLQLRWRQGWITHAVSGESWRGSLDGWRRFDGGKLVAKR